MFLLIFTTKKVISFHSWVQYFIEYLGTCIDLLYIMRISRTSVDTSIKLGVPSLSGNIAHISFANNDGNQTMYSTN